MTGVAKVRLEDVIEYYFACGSTGLAHALPENALRCFAPHPDGPCID